MVLAPYDQGALDILTKAGRVTISAFETEGDIQHHAFSDTPAPADLIEMIDLAATAVACQATGRPNPNAVEATIVKA